ncbi:uncharacterized protein V1516DRAFT_617954, partial [Lipomyces oligophaga]|uniref:uncharacterized protein n=1 Tax=Lipomyces oligophaga TaxID=45792 RepID=UPI0034CF807F
TMSPAKDPFLSLAVDHVISLDTSEPENLFSIWNVFAKCAENLENGRRLENLSWRVWNRETFVCHRVRDIHTTDSSTNSPVVQINSITQKKRHHRQSHRIRSASRVRHASSAERFQRVLESIRSEKVPNWQKPVSLSTTFSNKPTNQVKLLSSQSSYMTESQLSSSSISALDKDPCGSVSRISASKELAPSARNAFQLSDCEDLSDILDNDEYDEEQEENEERNNDEECSHLHRAVPSTTSVVKGFSPSAISVHSVRSNLAMASMKSQLSMSSSQNKQPSSSIKIGSMGHQVPKSVRSSDVKRGKMFFIESSPSESDGLPESISPSTNAVIPTSNLTGGGGSSHTNFSGSPLRRSMNPQLDDSRSTHRKRASFLETVTTIPSVNHEGAEDAVDEDDEDYDDLDEDYVSESAIDDAESDWDSVDDDNTPSFDETQFLVRDRSVPAITSRRSLLSTLLLNEDQSEGFSQSGIQVDGRLITSQSSPSLVRSGSSRSNAGYSQGAAASRRILANQHQHRPGPSSGLTMEVTKQTRADLVGFTQANTTIQQAGRPSNDEVASAAAKMARLNVVRRSEGAEIPVSRASNIAATAMPTLSPRSTRRNMLATELSESLRRNLLWERQQKTVSSRAVLKRRHTTQDMSNLLEYPERPSQSGNNTEGSAVGNLADKSDFDNMEFGYHARGW